MAGCFFFNLLLLNSWVLAVADCTRRELQAIGGKNQKNMASYKFWQTQPVPSFRELSSFVLERRRRKCICSSTKEVYFFLKIKRIVRLYKKVPSRQLIPPKSRRSLRLL